MESSAPLQYSNRRTGRLIAASHNANQSTEAMTAELPFSLHGLEWTWQNWCHFCGSEIIATGTLILVLGFALRILRTLGRTQRRKNWSDTLSALVTDPVLVVDAAIEYPLFFAFHPVTLSSEAAATSTRPFPEAAQLTFQFAVLYFVELAFGHIVLRRISFLSGAAGPSAAESDKSASSTLCEDGSDDDAARLAMEFLRPRSALLLSVALPAASSAFSVHCGAFHPVSIALWAATRQLLVKSDGEVVAG